MQEPAVQNKRCLVGHSRVVSGKEMFDFAAHLTRQRMNDSAIPASRI